MEKIKTLTVRFKVEGDKGFVEALVDDLVEYVMGFPAFDHVDVDVEVEESVVVKGRGTG